MAEQVSHARLFGLREGALRYLRVEGADKPRGFVPISDLRKHLEATDVEYRALYLLLHNDGLARTNGRNDHMYLTNSGKRHADKIDSPEAKRHHQQFNVHALNAILQIAGEKSTQSAQIVANASQVAQILDEIEQAMPNFHLDEKEREEAVGLAAPCQEETFDLEYQSFTSPFVLTRPYVATQSQQELA